jgi:hypothetical protein
MLLELINAKPIGSIFFIKAFGESWFPIIYFARIAEAVTARRALLFAKY